MAERVVPGLGADRTGRRWAPVGSRRPGSPARYLVPLLLVALVAFGLTVSGLVPLTGSVHAAPPPARGTIRATASRSADRPLEFVTTPAGLPTPRGAPDPTLPFSPSAATARLLHHDTRVTALLEQGPRGFSYASDVGWLAYAPWDQSFYVAAPPSDVDVIPAGTVNVTQVIAVGSAPFGVAVDPALKEVFVTNQGSSNVTVIDGTSQSSIGSVATPSYPTGIAFDATDGTVYVADNASGSVTVFGAANRTAFANVTVGSLPTGVAWDNATDQVFVTDQGADNVTVLAGGNESVVATVAVGSAPDGLAVDNLTDAVYVANEGSNNVSVINASSDALNATVPVAAYGYTPDLQSVAYDSVHHVIWVTAGFSTVVINTTLERVTDEIEYDPAGIAFDPDNGNVCITNAANVTFGCFQFLGSGFVGSPANITFHETGLPAGRTWNVTLSGADTVTQAITGASFTFGVDVEHAYNYSYRIGPSGGYAPDNASGYVATSWFWASPNVTVNVSFQSLGRYIVNVSESGLRSGLTWAFALNGYWQTSDGPTMLFSEKTGLYRYTVGALSGWYSSPSSGTLDVNRSSTGLAIEWGRGSGSSTGYNVTFTRSGMPGYVDWKVDLSNATWGQSDYGAQPSFNFSIYDGSYQYTVSAPTGWTTPNASGTVVVNGADVAITVPWSWVGYYTANFTETGLPNGTWWAVAVQGYASGFGSYGSSITVDLSDGSYWFTVFNITDYSVVPWNGTVTIAGSNLTVPIRWSQTLTYAVTFAASGLANGTAWSLDLTGPNIAPVSASSSTLSIVLSEPTGAYDFVVPPLTSYGQTEYEAVPSSGNFTVWNGAVTVPITFVLAADFYAVEFIEQGLPQGTGWSVSIGGAALPGTGPSITAPELNGTYAYSAGGAWGFLPRPANGTVVVRGGPVQVAITFMTAPGFFAVTFEEEGLGPATLWAVDFAGDSLSSSGASIEFVAGNGTYGYAVGVPPGYRAETPTGTVWVNGTAPVPVTIRFASTDLFSVTFTEQGLPAGTGWAVSIGSQLDSSLTPTVTIAEPNGTFGYLVLPVNAYTTTDSGFVTVNDSNTSVAITFVPQTYPVIVVEFGLPNGTSWSVTVVNATLGINRTYTTTSSALIFYLPNGTYRLTVQAAGYMASLSAPGFTVAGRLVGGSPTARFSPGSNAGAAGLSLTTIGLVIATVAALGLLGAFLLGRGRERAARREGEAWLRELTDDPGGADRREPP